MLSRLFFFVFCSIVLQINGQYFSEEIDLSKSINYPENSVMADIDNDGDLDVFCTSIGDGKVAFFENLGTGNFAEIQVISYAARSATQLFFEDLNGDGWLDLISSSSNYQGLFWMENLGGGNFGPEQVIETAQSGVINFTIKDADNDNDQDIIAYSAFASSNALEIFKNDGSGNFNVSASIADFDEDISHLELADLNMDGFADIFMHNGFEDIFIYMPNDGSGQFLQRDTTSTQLSLGKKFTLFDMNNDGDLDVISGQFVSPGALVWYPNNGSGAFGSPITIQEGFNNFKDISVADFDNDGDSDFVVLATEVKYLERLSATSFATFDYVDDVLIGLQSISSGDLTGNGFQDILIATHGLGWDDYLIRFENVGNASFGSPLFFNPQDPNGPHSLATGDIDGDGDYDIATATLHNDLVLWYENNGIGGFAESHITSENENSAYRHIELADLDGDGDLDIITGSSGDNHISWQSNDGAGNFSAMMELTNDADYPYHFEIDDLDGDGDMDIVAAAYDDGEIKWFKNDGSENFNNEIILSEDAFQARKVAIADLNEDGNLDIVSCSFGTHSLVWFEGLGAGEFSDAQGLILFDDVKTFTWGDFNFDGHIDIVGQLSFGGDLRKYLNDGSGNFELVLNDFDVFSPNDLYAMDIDSDGDRDLVMAGTGGIQFAFNWGTNGFSEADFIRNYSAGFVELNSADFDNDGDEDLVYADIFSDRIALLMNQSSFGCTDNSACNYDEDAVEDDGSCCYSDCGCTNPNAINYSPAASCDDGSCQFNAIGMVYFDENNNGLFDSLDYGLANQEIEIFNLGVSAFTNNNGFFSVNLADANELTFSHQEDTLFPFYTTADQITFNTDTSGWNTDTMRFGISNTVAFFELDVNLYGATNVCLDVNPNVISVENNGSAPLELLIEFEKDALLNLISSSLPIDSVDGTTCFLSYSELLPGQSLGINLYFDVISADNIGDSLISHVNVQAYHLGALVAVGDDTVNEIVECSYDPNDKQVFPEGYGPNHWVQNDTILEYMIRFQNTGNAPAQNIWIRDSLDQALDLSTFEFLSSSHLVNTSIDPQSRELLFFFEDIMLPDSVNNETESHGYVRFAMRAASTSPLLTEINNTAHIFFDNNDPIVTNTTWSTLYDCSLFEANFEYSLGLLMASEGDQYQWYINGVEIPGAINQTYAVEQNDFHSVLVSINFPCSSFSEEEYVTIGGLNSAQQSPFIIYPNPSSDFTLVEWAQTLEVRRIQLLDITGREVLNADLSNGNMALIPTDNISAGTYIIRVFSEQGIFDAKLIVAQN